MRVIALIILTVLIGQSCAKPVDPPREDEAKKIINDWFDGKDDFSYFLTNNNDVSKPWLVKETRILSIERLQGARKLFKIIAVSKGTQYSFEMSRQFYDTIRLEIKKESNGWSKKKMEHDFKYPYDPYKRDYMPHF
jgi:hypothetical protein